MTSNSTVPQSSSSLLELMARIVRQRGAIWTVVSQSEFLSAVRRVSRAIKRERTLTESRQRRLNRWPPGGVAAGVRRRMACQHRALRGGGRVDTHR